MGKMINVNILIEQFSTPDDRKALVDAFARSEKTAWCVSWRT
jgi:hypothetical protein